MTQNITFAIDESDLAAARRYAAERSTTVSALVRTYLKTLNDADERRRAAVARMRARAARTGFAESAEPMTRGWGDHAD